MPVDTPVDSAYVAAVARIAARIAGVLRDVPPQVLPIRMIIAGGTALHFHTGARTSLDIDAVFSHRIALPDGLDTVFVDADGHSRVLYLDGQYNDTLGLMHEDARDDALPLSLPGVDPALLDVRILTAVDLAVSKLSRCSDQDVADIRALADRGLVTAQALQARAGEAMGGYVGDLKRLEGNLQYVMRILEAQLRRD
ncbi:MAG: hypothetical protein RL026_1951 [Pseudomonadota bacterium]|jgi:hypothetical protein